MLPAPECVPCFPAPWERGSGEHKVPCHLSCGPARLSAAASLVSRAPEGKGMAASKSEEGRGAPLISMKYWEENVHSVCSTQIGL